MRGCSIKSVRTMIFLIILLVLLITPQMHSLFINQTFSKNLYPSGSYIITTMPTATFPNDHVYCNIGQSNIEVTVVFHNTEYSNSITGRATQELDKAEIAMTYNYVDFNDETDVYFDFEFEMILRDYRDQYSSDYVIAITDMKPPADGEYYNLGGYARLQNYCAIVFADTLQYDSYVSSIFLHELCHLLGYWHSDNPLDVMYPTYSGGNNILTEETIETLYDLHH